MRIPMVAALAAAGILVGGTALADSDKQKSERAQICFEQAQKLGLNGDSLDDFVAACDARQVAQQPTASERWQQCQEETKLASGEQKRQAMKECMAGF